MLSALHIFLNFLFVSATTRGIYRDGEIKEYDNHVTVCMSNESAHQEELMNANETSGQVCKVVSPKPHKHLTVYAKNATGKSTEDGRMDCGLRNITEIRTAIQKYNDAQTIYNEHIYGPVQNDTLIIAIQVHTRPAYLRYLIGSLARARDINKTLLVFSHDYYGEETNALVRSINFTKVMQIFYPYSLQTHRNKFPGMDPNDCPRNAKYDEAIKLGCNNAKHPDSYGHYREANYTQTKHHWWWKANRIFNQLQCTIGHTGMVLFLEEDHYVAEDFIYMLNLLRTTAEKCCPYCEILSLGTYLEANEYYSNDDKRKNHLTMRYIQQLKALDKERRRRQELCSSIQNVGNLKACQYHSNSDKRKKQLTLKYIRQLKKAANKERRIRQEFYSSILNLEITPWHSTMHNMGFAFNRTVWNSIMELQELFCNHDDYNWDHSLLRLSLNRPDREKFQVILCKWPRVFHIGKCGTHHQKSNCNASTVIKEVQKLLQDAKLFMYLSPVNATVKVNSAKNNIKLIRGYGGWEDIRDRELCTNMTKIGRENIELL